MAPKAIKFRIDNKKCVVVLLLLFSVLIFHIVFVVICNSKLETTKFSYSLKPKQ